MGRLHRPPSSPRARKVAERLGIQMEALVGSGPSGRIVAADVLNAPPGPRVRSRITSSPLARKIAAKLGIPLETLTGSGPNGRIVKADVLHAAATAPKSQGTPQALLWHAAHHCHPPYGVEADHPALLHEEDSAGANPASVSG